MSHPKTYSEADYGYPDATNPTVDNRERRLVLRCSLCRPNKGENQKCHKKHGVKKPRRGRRP